MLFWRCETRDERRMSIIHRSSFIVHEVWRTSTRYTKEEALKNTRNILLSLLLLALLSGCSSRDKGQIQGADAPLGAVPALAASYSVNGVDPQGTEYGGNLQLRPGDAPGTYALQWIITGSIQEGFGLLQGNQLLVRWRTTDGIELGVTGLTTYTITTEGELYGPRTIDGVEKAGEEKAFPNPPD